MYDYEAGKLDWLAAGLETEGRAADAPTAKTLARTDVATCALDDNVGEARRRAESAGMDVCVVVNDRRVVLGLLREEELAGRDDVPVAEVMRAGPSTFRPHVPIAEMAEYMVKHDLPNTPITTSDGTLIGVLVAQEAVQAAHEQHEH